MTASKQPTAADVASEIAAQADAAVLTEVMRVVPLGGAVAFPARII